MNGNNKCNKYYGHILENTFYYTDSCFWIRFIITLLPMEKVIQIDKTRALCRDVSLNMVWFYTIVVFLLLWLHMYKIAI